MNIKKSPQTQRIFLAEYAATCSITKACDAAGISRQTAHNWLNTDEEFRAAFEDAGTYMLHTMQDAMAQRGIEGYDEPVFHDGIVVGTKRKFSDRLLIYLHEVVQSSKYRKHQVNAVNTPHPNPLAGMSQDAIAAKINSILEAAHKRREARKQVECDELV